MEIYRSRDVEAGRAFYGHLLENPGRWAGVCDHLTALARRLLDGLKRAEPYASVSLANHHPGYIGTDASVFSRKTDWDPGDAQTCIASEYGYGNWQAVMEGRDAYNMHFESALEALLVGDASRLRLILENHPEIATMPSLYGHKATLLHYCVANGVEIWRQQVPLNVVALTGMLLEHGADRNARAYVYGGLYTPADLLESSAHPRQAGVLKGLRVLLG